MSHWWLMGLDLQKTSELESMAGNKESWCECAGREETRREVEVGDGGAGWSVLRRDLVKPVTDARTNAGILCPALKAA